MVWEVKPCPWLLTKRPTTTVPDCTYLEGGSSLGYPFTMIKIDNTTGCESYDALSGVLTLPQYPMDVDFVVRHIGITATIEEHPLQTSLLHLPGKLHKTTVSAAQTWTFRKPRSPPKGGAADMRIAMATRVTSKRARYKVIPRSVAMMSVDRLCKERL